MHVNHFAVHLKQMQPCKPATVQYKMKNLLKENKSSEWEGLLLSLPLSPSEFGPDEQRS